MQKLKKAIMLIVMIGLYSVASTMEYNDLIAQEAYHE